VCACACVRARACVCLCDNVSVVSCGMFDSLFTGSTIDLDHRPAVGVDWSRDATASGDPWQPTAGGTAYQPGYRSVKFQLPF